MSQGNLELFEPLTRIETPKDSYVVDYPVAIEMAEKQAAIIWFAEELGVEKDENDIRTKCTEGERHGITTVLKLFTQYELMLGGEEFWGGKVPKMFPRPEIQRMAATFSFVELGVHAPFYDLINKTLGIATDEFYTSWKEDEILRARMSFVERYADSDNKLEATAAFAFMEGAVLFSSFAFLKSFNVGGYNMIPHITAGIDASSKDENQHSLASAWLFQQLLAEKIEAGYITDEQIAELKANILKIAEEVYEHEERICDMIFEVEGIRTIKKDEILHFVRDRINVVLSYLGVDAMFTQESGKVTKWFYNQLSMFKMSDFFAATQTQYKRDWSKHKLTFRKDLVGEGV